MCETLRIGDSEIQTIVELRKVWPRLVADPVYRDLDLSKPIPDGEDCCLCPVDLEASAEANGRKVMQDATDADLFIVEKERGK